MRLWLAGASTWLLLATLPSAAREEQVEATYKEQVAVEWVLVPAVIRGPSGYLRGLEARDFELVVDGQPASIESFEASADAPVSLIHLQDLSGSMALDDKLTASRRILSCILESARPGDEFAVASWGSNEPKRCAATSASSMVSHCIGCR